MKFIVIFMAVLWGVLSWFANSVNLKAEEITTENLISQNFTDGSWNNPVNSWHAPNDLAGWNGMEHTTEVTYTPETDALKENGFSMNAGAEIFHWYNNQTVHIRQSVTLDNGHVITQTKDYTASRGTVHDVENTIVISSNTSATYDLLMGIGFTDTRGLDGHRSADVRDPYITLTYNNEIFQLDDEIEDQLQEDLIVDEKIFDDFKIEDEIVMEDFKSFEEPKVFEEVVDMSFKEIVEEPKLEAEVKTEEIVEEKPNEIVEQFTEEFKEEITEEIAEERTEEVSQETTEKEAVEEKPKEEVKTKVASNKSKSKKLNANIDKVMAQVDSKIKDAAKNLEVKSIIKIQAMKSEVSLDTYANQKFYIPKDIYLGNNLIDNRDIYNTVSLASYIANDPVNIKNNKLQDININKQRLLLEIKQLKNG